MNLNRRIHPTKGFTLLEVMVVIALLGIIIAAAQFNFSSYSPEKELERQGYKFKGLFEIAAEYGMLNNIELGVVVDKNSYQFVAYDGVRWVPVPDEQLAEPSTLPEELSLTLTFEDLPIEEPMLYTTETFIVEDDDDNFKEEEEKKIIPQIYILSGGDITPFNLRFEVSDTAPIYSEAYVDVLGLYSTPLTLKDSRDES